MENRIGIKIHHKPLFSIFLGTVNLKNAAMDFEDYLKIKSGTATIHYPLNGLFRRTLLLSIQAENLAVEPGAELKSALGHSEVIFDRVSARLLIQPDRKVVIDFLNAESKTIQFHLGAKDLHETRQWK